MHEAASPVRPSAASWAASPPSSGSSSSSSFPLTPVSSSALSSHLLDSEERRVRRLRRRLRKEMMEAKADGGWAEDEGEEQEDAGALLASRSAALDAALRHIAALEDRVTAFMHAMEEMEDERDAGEDGGLTRSRSRRGDQLGQRAQQDDRSTEAEPRDGTETSAALRQQWRLGDGEAAAAAAAAAGRLLLAERERALHDELSELQQLLHSWQVLEVTEHTLNTS